MNPKRQCVKWSQNANHYQNPIVYQMNADLSMNPDLSLNVDGKLGPWSTAMLIIFSPILANITLMG